MIGAAAVWPDSSRAFVFMTYKPEGFQSGFKHWHWVHLQDPDRQLVPADLKTLRTTRKPVFSSTSIPSASPQGCDYTCVLVKLPSLKTQRSPIMRRSNTKTDIFHVNVNIEIHRQQWLCLIMDWGGGCHSNDWVEMIQSSFTRTPSDARDVRSQRPHSCRAAEMLQQWCWFYQSIWSDYSRFEVLSWLLETASILDVHVTVRIMERCLGPVLSRGPSSALSCQIEFAVFLDRTVAPVRVGWIPPLLLGPPLPHKSTRDAFDCSLWSRYFYILHDGAANDQRWVGCSASVSQRHEMYRFDTWNACWWTIGDFCFELCFLPTVTQLPRSAEGWGVLATGDLRTTLACVLTVVPC